MFSQEEIQGNNSHGPLIATEIITEARDDVASSSPSTSSSHPLHRRSQVYVAAAALFGLLYIAALGLDRTPISSSLDAVPSYPRFEAESFFNQSEDTDSLLQSPTPFPSRNQNQALIAAKLAEMLSLEQMLEEKLRLETVVKQQDEEIVRKRALRSNMSEINKGYVEEIKELEIEIEGLRAF